MRPLQPGDPDRVGRYRLGGRLGEGGMGAVFWGRSPSGRPVAVKLVHRHLASQPEFRLRFAQEIQAARRVGGFHTATVVDADPDADPPWLVTAYVAGPSLAAAVERNGPFDAGALRVLGAGLAEALEAVHDAGLVHRDLKPTNVLLTDDGPRVIDFGIARSLDATSLTRAGSFIGTPKYMAPEQFGTDDPITPAVDVFAWAAVVCHAAGAPPFADGPAAEMAVRILTRPPDLSRAPAELRDLLSRCLDKDPFRRPRPAELLDALSDGTSSQGWLPPRVRTMLAEYVLPDRLTNTDDRTAPAGPTEDCIDAGPAAPSSRPPIPSAPATVAATAPGPARDEHSAAASAAPARRSGVLAGVIALAVLLAAGIVYAVIALTGAGRSDDFAGTWRGTDTADGSALELRLARAGTSRYRALLHDSSAQACAGQEVSLTAENARLEGQVLLVTWVLTCPGSSRPKEPNYDQLRYDPATDAITDNSGTVFTRS